MPQCCSPSSASFLDWRPDQALLAHGADSSTSPSALTSGLPLLAHLWKAAHCQRRCCCVCWLLETSHEQIGRQLQRLQRLGRYWHKHLHTARHCKLDCFIHCKHDFWCCHTHSQTCMGTSICSSCLTKLLLSQELQPTRCRPGPTSVRPPMHCPATAYRTYLARCCLASDLMISVRYAASTLMLGKLSVASFAFSRN